MAVKNGNSKQETQPRRKKNRGFSRFDIKESFAYDKNEDLILFGNRDAKIFAVDRKTGEQRWVFNKARFGFIATPVVYENNVIIGCLDKNVYCIESKTGKEKWRWAAGARVFASPVIINGKVYIGANTGRLTELDPKTGKELSFIAVPERITNKIAYNPVTKQYFLPTFANEIYCLEKNQTLT